MVMSTPDRAASITTRVIGYGRYRIEVVTRGPVGGPAAIVLPGLGGGAYTLAPQVRLLRRLGYTTHRIELPGFGLGPPLRTEDAHFDQLADHVSAAADQLGVREGLFVGHSLGGGVALYVALRRPELVGRLALLAPAAVGCSLSWMYRLFVLPLVGRALLRPHERGTPALLRAFGLGRIRRDDPHFGGCGPYGGVALPPLRSAPYVSAAYQPGPMCRPYSGPLLRLSVPGPVVARASGHACTGRPFGRRRWPVSRGLAAVEISRSRRHAAEKGGVS